MSGSAADFEGSIVAIVTPFKDGEVDQGALEELVHWHAESGTTAVVVSGTTGESPTLSGREREVLIKAALRAADGRLQIVAGTGTNNTRKVVEASKAAEAAGAHGLLVVTPYYNKPTQAGLLAHYRAVGDAVGIPIILYSVPSRTGVEIAPETVVRLAEHPRIAALKEAGGRVDRVSEIRQLTDLTILSGDDPLALPMIAVGAAGVVSVTANVAPRETSEMVRYARTGVAEEALMLHERLYPLSRAMFIETNPVPVKTALSLMGRIEPEFRLPITPMTPDNRDRLAAALREFGILDPDS